MQLKPQVNVDVEQQTVEFIWEDRQLMMTHHQLREICPCAFCRVKRLRNNAVMDQTMVHVTAMYDQGYGVQICFSDGHDKGIFPWIFLRNISQNRCH